MDCKEATRMLSEGLDRDLGIIERLRLQMHVSICRGCRSIGERFAFLRRAIQRAPAAEQDMKKE
jgi:predicted anti-sigma-YlaC factor YlaD